MPAVESSDLLKRDLLGAVWLCCDGERTWVRREIAGVRWWLRPLALAALRRERRALMHLSGIEGVPALLGAGRDHVDRSWFRGVPLGERSPDRTWFRRARGVLRRIHLRGVAHNDLAKEENWLVLDDGRAAVIDFQLAVIARSRRKCFRLMAREDLRHLLKHKRTFHRLALREVDRRLLGSPSLFSCAWRQTWKRAYNLVTRRLMGRRDGEGRGDGHRERLR